MLEEIRLTNEEIFFLGKITDGKHLDYSYLADMADIQQRKAMIEENCRNTLIQRGYAEESLWGEFSVNEEVQRFLSPVFNGHRDVVIDILYPKPEGTCQEALFFLENDRVLFSFKEGKINIFRECNEEMLKRFILSIMPEGYNKEKDIKEELEVSEIKRRIVVKYNEIGIESAVHEIFDLEGWLFILETENKMRLLNPAEFYIEIIRMITGGDKIGIS